MNAILNQINRWDEGVTLPHPYHWQRIGGGLFLRDSESGALTHRDHWLMARALVKYERSDRR